MAVIAFAAGFLEHLGYAPTAFIVVMALLQILGSRYWRRNLLISLAAGAVSHFLSSCSGCRFRFSQGGLIPHSARFAGLRDDFVRSPISALRFISQSLRRTMSTPHSARFARLELGLLTKSSLRAVFKEAQFRRCASPRRRCGVLHVRLAPQDSRALNVGFLRSHPIRL